VPHVYSIIPQSAFTSDTAKMMGKVFDQVWDAIEPEYREHREAEIDLARLALAKSLMLLVYLGNTDPDVLKGKALHVMKLPDAT
jgi:hypothetical protein